MKNEYPNIEYLRFLGVACRYARKKQYTMTTEGVLSKCGESVFALSNVLGKMRTSGDFEFYSNNVEWISDFETENCRNCEIYPLCGGRTCLYKKVHSI